MEESSNQQIFKKGFFSPSKGSLSFEKTLKEIVSYITEMPEKSYSIIVGCDSSSGQTPNFPVALVVLRQGQGGRFFLKKITYSEKKFYSWKERILQEVALSCQLALTVRERFQTLAAKFPASLSYDFKYIHADVGENGRTKDMIREVVGLIKGNGFEPCIKPQSFAASNVADRYS